MKKKKWMWWSGWNSMVMIMYFFILVEMIFFPSVSSSSSSSTSSFDDFMLHFNDGTLEMRANESLVAGRTEEILLHHQTCLVYRIRLEGRRTRLRVYACRMTMGGRCTFDLHLDTAGNEQCHRAKPWTYRPDRYAFYFQFERRPRRFSDDPASQRRRIRWLRSWKAQQRHVGFLQLGGLVNCSTACN